MDWGRLAEILGPPMIAFVGGVLVGRLQVNTEIMKLRHSIAERHVARFHGLADRFEAVLMEVVRNPAAAKEFLGGLPHVPLAILLAADRAMLPEHTKEIAAFRVRLIESCGELSAELHKNESDPALRSAEATMLIFAKSRYVAFVLSDMIKAVDLSNEARLYGNPPSRCASKLRQMMAGWPRPAPDM